MEEIRRGVGKRQEKGEGEEGLRKVRKEIEECRKTVDVIFSEVQNKLSLKEYETDLMEMRRRFEGMGRDLSGKANIKDVCVLADSKPSNSAFTQISTTSITPSEKSTKPSAPRWLKPT